MVPRALRLTAPHQGNVAPALRPPAKTGPIRPAKRKGPKKDRTALISLAITAVAMIGVLLNLDATYNLVFGKREEMAADFETLAKEIRSGATRDADGMFKMGGPATTDGEHLREVLLGFANDLIANMTRYEREMESHGLRHALSALAPYLREAKPVEINLMMAKSTETAESARRRGLNLLNGFPERIDNSPMDYATKKVLKRAYQDSQSVRLMRFEESWNMEIAWLEQATLAFDHLNGTRGGWGVNGNQILFREPSELSAMKEILTKMDEIRAKQAAMMRRLDGEPWLLKR
jgi:hypothetical protein